MKKTTKKTDVRDEKSGRRPDMSRARIIPVDLSSDFAELQHNMLKLYRAVGYLASQEQHGAVEADDVIDVMALVHAIDDQIREMSEAHVKGFLDVEDGKTIAQLAGAVQ